MTWETIPFTPDSARYWGHGYDDLKGRPIPPEEDIETPHPDPVMVPDES